AHDADHDQGGDHQDVEADEHAEAAGEPEPERLRRADDRRVNARHEGRDERPVEPLLSVLEGDAVESHGFLALSSAETSPVAETTVGDGGFDRPRSTRRTSR